MTRAAARRPAFTLIELLVVIALIALLSVIAVGAFGRIRLSQQKSAADATLNKLNSRIDHRMKAINDQVADDVKKNHPGYAAVFGQVQNADLAKAIWTYAKMKSELPMSLAEAKNPVVINIGGVAVWNIPPKAVFSALPAEANAYDESASCLYLAVTANAGGGTATDTDGLEQQTGTTSGGAKCFKDAWGTPIVFVRTVYNGEVAGPPFFVATASNPKPFDIFDPRQKLPAFAAVAGNANWWANAKANATIVPVPTTYPNPTVNHTWTVISAGPDRQWGSDIYGLAAGDTDAGKDNQVSYRLRREGNRGD